MRSNFTSMGAWYHGWLLHLLLMMVAMCAVTVTAYQCPMVSPKDEICTCSFLSCSSQGESSDCRVKATSLCEGMFYNQLWPPNGDNMLTIASKGYAFHNDNTAVNFSVVVNTALPWNSRHYVLVEILDGHPMNGGDCNLPVFNETYGITLSPSHTGTQQVEVGMTCSCGQNFNMTSLRVSVMAQDQPCEVFQTNSVIFGTYSPQLKATRDGSSVRVEYNVDVYTLDSAWWGQVDCSGHDTARCPVSVRRDRLGQSSFANGTILQMKTNEETQCVPYFILLETGMTLRWIFYMLPKPSAVRRTISDNSNQPLLLSNNKQISSIPTSLSTSIDFDSTTYPTASSDHNSDDYKSSGLSSFTSPHISVSSTSSRSPTPDFSKSTSPLDLTTAGYETSVGGDKSSTWGTTLSVSKASSTTSKIPDYTTSKSKTSNHTTPRSNTADNTTIKSNSTDNTTSRSNTADNTTTKSNTSDNTTSTNYSHNSSSDYVVPTLPSNVAQNSTDYFGSPEYTDTSSIQVIAGVVTASVVVAIGSVIAVVFVYRKAKGRQGKTCKLQFDQQSLPFTGADIANSMKLLPAYAQNYTASPIGHNPVLLLHCYQDPKHIQLVNQFGGRLQQLGSVYFCQIGDTSMLEMLRHRLQVSAGKARVVLVLCPGVRRIFHSHTELSQAWQSCLLREVGIQAQMYAAVHFYDFLSEADVHFFVASFGIENVYQVHGDHCELRDLLKDLTEAAVASSRFDSHTLSSSVNSCARSTQNSGEMLACVSDFTTTNIKKEMVTHSNSSTINKKKFCVEAGDADERNQVVCSDHGPELEDQNGFAQDAQCELDANVNRELGDDGVSEGDFGCLTIFDGEA